MPSATRVIPAVGSKEIAQSQSEAAYLRIRERIVSLEMPPWGAIVQPDARKGIDSYQLIRG
jgi:hypothetical protein